MGTETGDTIDNPRLAPRSEASGFGARVGRVRLGDLLLWYGMSSLAVYVVPTVLRVGQAPWNLPADHGVQARYWTFAFAASAFALVFRRGRAAADSRAMQAGLLLGPWVVAGVILFARSDIPHSRVIGLMSFVLGAVLLTFPAFLPTRLNWATFVIAVSGAFTGSELNERSRVRVEPPRLANEILMTSLLPVALTNEFGLIPDRAVRGGGIASLEDGFLLVTGEGTWFALSWDSTGRRLGARRLSLPAPSVRTGVTRDSIGTRKPLVRVTGLIIDTARGSGIAYVAHEVWKSDERCLALQVSAMPLRALSEENAEASWRPVFVTSPCIRPGLEFDPYEGGGRLALLPDGSLLLTVGDYGQNNVRERAAAQLAASDYGKTIRISRDGVGTVHTMGHRNPQGLTIDLEGNVWASEHGPKGGDEINLLKPGANYGWPLVTYGTDYDRYEWRGGALKRTHGTFTEPAFAFVPSVAISSLLTVRDTLFAPWKGDVLAGSLGGEQILRLRIVGGRVLYAESIAVGRRIRDMAEGADGRIVLWTDGGDVLWLSPSTAALDGAALFEMCIRCHGRMARGSDIGPRLAGLFDRPIASIDRFEYSEALRRLGGDWTDERLDAFLKSPATFAPGTTMDFAGVADSSERRMLREYLRLIAREPLTF